MGRASERRSATADVAGSRYAARDPGEHTHERETGTGHQSVGDDGREATTAAGGRPARAAGYLGGPEPRGGRDQGEQLAVGPGKGRPDVVRELAGLGDRGARAGIARIAAGAWKVSCILI